MRSRSENKIGSGNPIPSIRGPGDEIDMLTTWGPRLNRSEKELDGGENIQNMSG